MSEREERNRLQAKMAILEKIGANTESQRRFIRRREQRGLQRLIKEREKLIEAFCALKDDADGGPRQAKTDELRGLEEFVAAKQREIADLIRQTLLEAVGERERIAAELRNVRETRALRNRYDEGWQGLKPGRFLNQRG